MWKFTRDKGHNSKGFTLTELLVVIGIIAVVCAIAIPSVMAISRSLSFKQKNDYAKSIFLAAQANLTEMRSDGGLAPLQPQPDGSMPAGSRKLPAGTSGFPAADWSEEYAYAVSGGFAYNILLPTNSVDETVRSQNVLVEYNPITGNVYSVFYSEDKTLDLQARYTSASGLPRDDKAARKDMMLGYYCGSGLSSTALEVEESQTQLTFENDQEGILTVSIAIPEEYLGKAPAFVKGLNVDVTVLGELSEQLARKAAALPGGTPVTEEDYSFKVNIKKSGEAPVIKVSDDGKSVLFQYALDSLFDKESFASKAVGTATVPGPAGAAAVPAAAKKNLTEIRKEDEFKVLPGENVTLIADVTFAPEAGLPAVSVEPGVLAGVNPLYAHLIPSSTREGKYILGVSNGRNLQNLNILAPTVAKSVETVVFLDDISWSDTVSYYNGKVPGSYSSSGEEAPGRCLPYFVPIHHEDLFGTAQFVYPTPAHSGFWEEIGHILENLFGYNFAAKEKVPLLTDELDRKLPDSHAAIQGNGKKVSSLKINSDLYQVPAGGRFYATGDRQVIDYNFTGLFGYVNTTVDNLYVVNPIIKGRRFGSSPTASNPATGGLIGAGGYNTLVTNCGVYIDTLAPDFSRSRMGQQAYTIEGDQSWYGVSGAGAVGGLMGYSKSHRTVTGDLTDDLAHLAFSRSFAAVPVSGYMRADGNKDLGYARGVGGFIGNSQLTNFYNCYSSGNVISAGGLVRRTNLQNSFISETIRQLISDLLGGDIQLSYDGRTSYGTGGFVGTSHGTRYTNCFCTGTVKAMSPTGVDGISGAGGFVGVMSYEETHLYGMDDPTADKVNLAQRTVFDSCYSIGGAYVGGRLRENFSGANARIRIDTDDIGAALFAGDYYRLLAPHRYQYGSNPAYAQWYIFKDSYYLSQKDSDSINSNSNECATVASYDTLSDLVGNHRSTAWQNDRIAQIRALECAIRVNDLIEGLPIFGQVPLLYTTYGVKYFTAYEKEYSGPFITGIRAGKELPAATQAYRAQYEEGFPGTYWGGASTATTHAYGQTLSGGVYPFSKLNGLDYYGNWPSRPLEGGLAYYELYEDGSRGIYFDRDTTDNQKLKDNVPIVSDGYAILTANHSDTVRILAGDKWVKLDADGTSYEPGGDYSGSTFAVFPIPREYLNADSDSFYTRLQVSIKPKDGSKGEYTFYYNPGMALTQINPVAGRKEAAKPTSVPPQILIRTARQFRALGTMENFWTSDYHYYQALDVDASTYHWETSESAPVHTRTIGNAAHPFNGSYTGTSGAPAAIRGFLPGSNGADVGFFGNIGAEGSVRHLVLDLTAQTGTATVGSNQADNAGLLAGSCAGTLEDIDILLPEPAENGDTAAFTLNLEAKTSAGLLAGTASSNVTDCHVNGGTSNALTVSAEKAGAVLGLVHTVSASDLTLAGPLTLTGRQTGGFAGAGVSFDSVKVTLDGALTVNAQLAGGLAGALEGGEVRSCDVKLNSTVGGKDATFGGLAGSADTVKAVAVNAEIHGKVHTAQAAGLVGIAPKNLSVVNSSAILNAEVHGTERSAGAVGTLGIGSTLDTVTVDLTQGSVTSDAAAAGFAGTVNGKVSGSHVLLGGNATAQRISGKEAAGYVLTVDGGEVTHSSVSGKGKIVGTDRAAGFVLTVQGENGRVAASFVTPVQDNVKDNYLGNSTEKLTVSGGTVSGFAGDAATSTADESNAGLYNCWTLCDLRGNASGFAAFNTGKINGCFANVSMESGSAFVGENTGLVANSYGWFAGSAALPTDEAVGYRSCYFADLNPVKGQRSMVLFDKDTRAVPDMNAIKLAASLDSLRGPNGHWYVPGTFGSHPFEVMDPPDYPFPMLRDHYGNWLPAPHCAYGVAYYEVYGGAQTLTEPEAAAPVLWMHILDLSPRENSVENGSLTGSWSFDTSGSCTNAPSAPDSPIVEAGYVLFCKEGLKPPFEAGLMGEKSQALANIAIPNALEIYTFYRLNADSPVEITGKNTSAKVVPWFADELQDDGRYLLRTPGQFANVAKAPDAEFTQERDLAVDSFETVADFTGSYNGGGHSLVLTSAAPWITNLTGTVTGLNLTASAPLFGTVDGTAENMDLTVIGDLTAPLITTLNGTVSLSSLTLGDAANIAVGGALVETVNGSFGCPGGITLGNVDGHIFGTVTKPLSLSGLTAQAVGGCLVDTVADTGSVTLESLSVSGSTHALVNTLSGSFTVPGLTLGDVTGSAFGTVSGALELTGPVTLGNVSGHFIGTVSADVNLPAISAGVLSGSLLESGNAAVTGTTLTATEITAPVVNHLTGSLTGLTVENSNLKANVVGTADHAAVSGVTVKADGQALTQPVIGSMTGGKLNSLALTCGSLNRNVIGALSGGSLEQLTVTAETASVTGGVLAADAGAASITGCTVNIPAIQGLGSPFGILAGSASGEITGCTVSNTVLTADSGVIGGLVGQSSGILTDNSVSVTMNLAGTAEITAGGLAGAATGTLSGGNVRGSICLTPPAPGDQPEPPRFRYVIGGALGRDGSGVTCEGVTASVTVASDWADPNAAVSASDPAGKGPVGMFVGDVNDGTFTNCASTAENGTYQFLGKIAVTEQTAEALYRNDAQDAQTDFTVSVTRGEADAQKELTAEIAAAGYPEAPEKVTYTVYSATLENCRFQLNGQTCIQTFVDDGHYYSKGEPQKNLTHTAVKVTAEPTKVSPNPTFESLGTTDCSKVPIEYFCKVDGSYRRLYLSIVKRYNFQDWPKNYTLSYKTGPDTYELFNSVKVKKYSFGNDITLDQNWPDITIFTIPLVEPTANRRYAIQKQNGQACGLNDAGELVWKTLDPHDDRMLWILSKGQGEGTWSWKNKYYDSKFLGEDLETVSDSAVNMSIKLAGDPTKGFHIGTFKNPLRLTLIDVTANKLSVTMTPALTTQTLGYQPAGGVTPPTDPSVPSDPLEPPAQPEPPAAPETPEVPKAGPSEPVADPAGAPAANDPLPTVSGGENP